MTPAIQKITPFLWFNTQAEDAVAFYTSIFPNSSIVTTTRYGTAGAEVSGQPQGTVMTVEFRLAGQDFVALNGGPYFTFTEAISFVVNCESQDEVDYYWDKLSSGGDEPPMTSRKSKQDRLDESRLKIAAELSSIDTRDAVIPPPADAVMADQSELSHNNTYDRLPLFYVDKVLTCRECGKRELWTAEQQKWWYETAKGNINSTAVHCRACRDKRKAVRDAARKASEDGLLRKQNKRGA